MGHNQLLSQATYVIVILLGMGCTCYITFILYDNKSILTLGFGWSGFGIKAGQDCRTRDQELLSEAMFQHFKVWNCWIFYQDFKIREAKTWSWPNWTISTALSHHKLKVEPKEMYSWDVNSRGLNCLRLLCWERGRCRALLSESIQLFSHCQTVLTRSCYKLVKKPNEEEDYRCVILFVQWNKRQSSELNCLLLE